MNVLAMVLVKCFPPFLSSIKAKLRNISLPAVFSGLEKKEEKKPNTWARNLHHKSRVPFALGDSFSLFAH